MYLSFNGTYNAEIQVHIHKIQQRVKEKYQLNTLNRTESGFRPAKSRR